MTYAALENHHRRLAHLHHADAILGWDEATMMPEGGGEARAEALATLRGMIHAEATAPRLGELFASAETESNELESWQAANLREMKRAWTRATALPSELVEASSRAESRSEQAWRKLRAQNDWSAFAPLLEEVVRRKREVAQALSAKLGTGVYDALLDGFEPSAKSDDIARLFAELRGFLPDFIGQALEKQKAEPLVLPDGAFPVDQQRELGLSLMRRIGFDFSRGRLDVSHHPFCGGVPRDVRITTRYDTADFLKALMGVMHETGHAKYEQNLPGNWLEQPVGNARSMSLHESQSLLQEMQVCRSREFLEFAAPLIANAFPDLASRNPAALSAENLYRLHTRVKRDYIRVDADEATYPCHVIVRFEIEKPLIEGRIEVRDIPELWDAAMRDLLGLSTASNYKDGCMQDVHWPAGLFGYFPTYTLGALTAAQLFQAAEQALPKLRAGIASGDFAPLNGWLKDKVWALGSSLETEDIVTRATGKPLEAAPFIRHLKNRYLERS